jgi:hypothetical protein
MVRTRFNNNVAGGGIVYWRTLAANDDAISALICLACYVTHS